MNRSCAKAKMEFAYKSGRRRVLRPAALGAIALGSIVALGPQRALAQTDDGESRDYQPLTPRDARAVVDDGIGNTLAGGVGAASGFRGDCSQGGVAGRADVDGRYVQASASATQIYTDNLNREPEAQAESDWILMFSPRLGLCAATGRAQGKLSYSPQAVVYAQNNQFNDIYHLVAADSTVNLYGQRVFVDANTRYGQTVVEPSLGSPDSNAIRPDDQTSAWVANISPYAFQSFGDLATGSARYRYGVTEYGDEDVPDTMIQSAALNLASPQGRRLGWRASVVSQKVERSGGDRDRFFERRFDDDIQDPAIPPSDDGDDAIEDDDTAYFDQAELEINLQVSRALSLVASGGVETRYDDEGDAQRLEEPFYRIGARIASGRSVFAAGVSEHYYGTSFDASLERNGPRLRTSIAYREQANSAGRAQFNRGLNGNGFTGGAPGADSNDVIDGNTGSLFGRGVFIERRTEATATLDSGRATTSASVFQSERDYQRSGVSDDTLRGAAFNLSYQLQPRTELLSGVEMRERDDSGGDRFAGGYRSTDATIALQRTINRSVRASIGYLRGWGEGDNARSDFKENRVTLSVIKIVR